MDDQQRARELLAAECDADGFIHLAKAIRDGQSSKDVERSLRAITAALRAAPERELYEAARAFYNTISTIAVVIDLKASLPESWKLVESTGRRLCVALLNQRGVAVVPNGSQVVPPATLGAHEVHPEAVDSGFDLGEAGKRHVAADALEHASGVRGQCDGSATAPEVLHIQVRNHHESGSFYLRDAVAVAGIDDQSPLYQRTPALPRGRQ